MPGSALSWFKFHVDAHTHPKIGCLSDGAFRMLTRIWALAQQSGTPGIVQRAPGVGVDPEWLKRTAGVTGDTLATDLLKELATSNLIYVDVANVITVHDHEDNNRVPPSKTPEGRRLQKAKERSRARDVASVATVSPGVSPPTSDQSRHTEEEEEEEKEEEKLASFRSALTKELGVDQRFMPIGSRRDPDRVRRVRAELTAEIGRIGVSVAAASAAAIARDVYGREGRYPVLGYYLPALKEVGRSAPTVEDETKRARAREKAESEAFDREMASRQAAGREALRAL